MDERWRISSVCSSSIGRIPSHLVCVLVMMHQMREWRTSFPENWEQEALSYNHSSWYCQGYQQQENSDKNSTRESLQGRQETTIVSSPRINARCLSYCIWIVWYHYISILCSLITPDRQSEGDDCVRENAVCENSICCLDYVSVCCFVINAVSSIMVLCLC